MELRGAQERECGATGRGPDWPAIVERIRSNDPSGMEELYRIFCKGIRYFLFRRIGPQDLDDRIHDVFLIVSQAIQRGDLRDPERLAGYVRTIVRRQVAAQIDRNVRSRQCRPVEGDIKLSTNEPSPERTLIERQNVELAMRILNSLKRRDRDVLIRFYLNEESQAQICREMGLTETQFRLIKSRAKARFGELGKSRLALERTPTRDQKATSHALRRSA